MSFLNTTIGAGNAPTMSSREIADLCEKRHDNVMADIAKMLKEIGLNAPDFSGTYKTAQGNTYDCFNLPKDLTVTLITGYRADLRYKVVKRLEELESIGKPIDPMKVLADPAAMRGLLLSYTEQVIHLQAQVTDLSAKGAALDLISTADGSLNITAAAKALQVRPKDLFNWLKQSAWIYRRVGNSEWTGYQERISSGFVEHKVTTVPRQDGTERISHQVRLTAKGMSKLAQAFAKELVR